MGGSGRSGGQAPCQCIFCTFFTFWDDPSYQGREDQPSSKWFMSAGLPLGPLGYLRDLAESAIDTTRFTTVFNRFVDGRTRTNL